MVGVVADAACMEVVAFRATAALNCVVIGADTTAVRRGNVFAVLFRVESTPTPTQ